MLQIRNLLDRPRSPLEKLKNELIQQANDGIEYLCTNGAYTLEDYKLMVGQIMAYDTCLAAIERHLEQPDLSDDDFGDEDEDK